MKTKIESRKGFTLIELMVAIAASAIVILAIGIVIVFGQTSWNDTWTKVNLQRDASYAMLRMSQSIKKATSAAADVNGPVLSLVVDGNSVIFSYAQDTNDLQYQIGGQSETIINGKVENLQFKVQGSTVEITLELEKDNVQTRFVSTVMMRNTGG
jgi:prepilin-type N-terminal cleavage/methylation domain-containing protein